MSAEELIALCREERLTLSIAESCTGGGLGAALTSVPGSSAVFMGGIISYSNAVKHQLLGVSEKSLREFGAVSQEVAQEMAMGVNRAIPANLSVAITGVAGPGADGPKPEGRVCFGFLVATGKMDLFFAETIEFGAIGRDNVRSASISHAIARLLQILRKN